MPSPDKEENKDDYISRCMGSEESKKSFPDQKRRAAFCHSKWRKRSRGALQEYLERVLTKKRKKNNE